MIALRPCLQELEPERAVPAADVEYGRSLDPRRATKPRMARIRVETAPPVHGRHALRSSL